MVLVPVSVLVSAVVKVNGGVVLALPVVLNAPAMKTEEPPPTQEARNATRRKGGKTQPP